MKGENESLWDMFSRFASWFRERQIGFRLKKFGRWTVDYYGPLWITILGIVGAFAFGWEVKKLGSSEFALPDQLRVTGWLLQVLGLSTVALGLKKTREIFGVPPATAQFVEGLRRFPEVLERRKPITVMGSSATAKMTAGTGYATVDPRPDASVEERLEVLEKKYKQLNQQLIDAQSELKFEARRLDGVIEEERNVRNEADAEIREQLEMFSVGGLHLETMGLIWLLAGITCAALPGELAALWPLF